MLENKNYGILLETDCKKGEIKCKIWLFAYDLRVGALKKALIFIRAFRNISYL